jgi:RNA-binding protein YhbY
MLDNKTKDLLRKLAQTKDILHFNVGKGVLSNKAVENIANGLAKHELVKVSFLKSAREQGDKGELEDKLVLVLGAEAVSKVGNTLLIYRYNPKNKAHVL